MSVHNNNNRTIKEAIVGEWSAWTVCSKSCGGGSSTRECLIPNTTTASQNCVNITHTTLKCNKQPCPIDGGWAEWGACSKKCGGGTKTRECSNPHRKDGGKDCVGDKEADCNVDACKAGDTFGPVNIENMDSTRTEMQFLTVEKLENIKKCRSNFKIETDLRFRMQRDDSESDSSITYWRPDLNQVQTFSFKGGYADHTRVEFDGQALTCLSNNLAHQCKSLEEGVATKAVILSIDFNPRNGKAHKNQWSRNKYSISGSFYYIKCSETDIA